MCEMERAVDMDLFLGAQNEWPKDSPHHLMILHEMLPQLNPEAGIPAIQLVWPETSREEFLDIYLEVYKLHR